MIDQSLDRTAPMCTHSISCGTFSCCKKCYSAASSWSGGPLAQLSREITSAVELINSHSLLVGLRSYSIGEPTTTLLETAPSEVSAAKRSIMAAAAKIQGLVMEPSDYLPNLTTQYTNVACINWLCRFRIPSHIPLKGAISYSALADAASVPEVQLRSIARMAMIGNFFCEPTPGEVAHTGPSILFVTDPSYYDWAFFMNSVSCPVALKMAECTEKFGYSTEATETAFNITLDTKLPFFDYMSQAPETSKAFALYMKNVAASAGLKFDHLLNGFDWAGLGHATVVDVGGSAGHASIALANEFPNLKFIIQDLPVTIAEAKTGRSLENQPISVVSRIKFQEHNFFDVQPVVASVYLLRMILHDWSLTPSIKILRNFLPTLQSNPGARVIIMDTVLPKPGSISPHEEAVLRVRDLTMMQAFNSHERELVDWEDLLVKASDGHDGRLVLKNVVKPPGSFMSVMEIVYVTSSE